MPIALSLLLALEGISGLLSSTFVLPRFIRLTPLGNSFNGGSYLSLLSAALLVMDVTAIHIRTPFFKVVWAVKFFCSLYALTCSLISLLFVEVSGLQRIYTLARLPFNILWVGSCIDELVLWNQITKSVALTIPGFRIPSDSGVSSYGTDDESVFTESDN